MFSGERQEIWTIQEEPPEDFLKKGVLFLLDDIGRSRKLCHIHWKTPVLQSFLIELQVFRPGYLDQKSELFLLYVQVKVYQNMLKLSCFQIKLF